jgi:GTP-binding protein
MNNKVNYYRRAKYLTSANHLDQLVEDLGREVAFAGRSNAGKSSALNTIADIGNLARTSKTPGRTQMINFFDIDADRRLVDLPGYGYAKVPERIKKHWEQVLNGYFSKRESLKGVILLVDARHQMKDFDYLMLEYCQHKQIPIHILMTKSDKLKRGAAKSALLNVQKSLKENFSQSSAQLFSSLKKEGVDQVRAIMDQWLGFEELEAL